MSKILVVDDDPQAFRFIETGLAAEGHSVRYARDAESGLALIATEPFDLVLADLVMPEIGGLEFLERLRLDHPGLKTLAITEPGTSEAVVGALREHVCDFLVRPFTASELREAVNAAITLCPAADIDVVSANPEWVELRVPCGLDAVPPLERLLSQLETDLPQQMREAIAYAFREMLNNAIEHGCQLDQSKRVEVRYVRLKRAIICWIKDPGKGFNPAQLEHAAVSNPSENPMRHVAARNEKGMRAGGFGILVTNQLVDELIYNAPHNELLFVKYLP